MPSSPLLANMPAAMSVVPPGSGMPADSPRTRAPIARYPVCAGIEMIKAPSSSFSQSSGECQGVG